MNADNAEVKRKPKTGIRKVKKGDILTVSQEKFAQGLAAGKKFDVAFREAYDCSNWADLSVYKKSFAQKDHPKIAARVKELRELIDIATKAKVAGEKLPSSTLPVVRETAQAHAKTVEQVLITRQTMTNMMLESRSRAHELGQISAAVGSEKSLCQLHGLISDNRDATKQLTAIEQMTVDQLRDFILQELPQVGLSPSDVGLDFVSMNPNPKALN